MCIDRVGFVYGCVRVPFLIFRLKKKKDKKRSELGEAGLPRLAKIFWVVVPTDGPYLKALQDTIP